MCHEIPPKAAQSGTDWHVLNRTTGPTFVLFTLLSGSAFSDQFFSSFMFSRFLRRSPQAGDDVRGKKSVHVQ